MNTPPIEEDIVVFKGSQRACLEFGLVLDAKFIAYQLIQQDMIWVLAVPAPLEATAREELGRYAAERRIRRPQPPALNDIPGAAIGVTGYVIVLLLTAHAASAGWFGVNWLDAGALQRSGNIEWPWWRALTALTLHLDVLHLSGNLLFGAAAGMIAGRLFGPGVAWAAIIAAAMLANLLELWLAPLGHRSVGASTAVFAALGLLSGYGWGLRQKLAERWLHRWAPLIAGACLLTLLGSGDTNERVDVVGHLLGFISGVPVGYAFARRGWPRNRSRDLQIVTGAVTLAALLLAWWRAVTLSPDLG